MVSSGASTAVDRSWSLRDIGPCSELADCQEVLIGPFVGRSRARSSMVWAIGVPTCALLRSERSNLKATRPPPISAISSGAFNVASMWQACSATKQTTAGDTISSSACCCKRVIAALGFLFRASRRCCSNRYPRAWASLRGVSRKNLSRVAAPGTMNLQFEAAMPISWALEL